MFRIFPRSRLAVHGLRFDFPHDSLIPGDRTPTEGRAYNEAEYRGRPLEAGLSPAPVVPTLVHCGLPAAVKFV